MRSIAALAILLTLIAAPAQAELFRDVYVGLRAGNTWTNVDSDNLSRELRARGHSVSATVDDSDRAGEIYFGTVVAPHFAVELSLRRMGQFDVAVTGTTTASEAQLREDVIDAGPKGGYAVGIGGRAEIPIGSSDTWFFCPRLGLLAWRQQGDVTTSSGTRSADQDGIGEFFGLGLDMRVLRNFAVGIGGELVRPDEQGTNQFLFGQVEFRF